MSTTISWADETWNPTTGCSRKSAGCQNCYAEVLSLRQGWSSAPWTAQNAALNFKTHPERLRKPGSLKKPSHIFVNSMSDLFHELMPAEFLRAIWQVMLEVPRHTYMILTKRPERLIWWEGPWAPQIWQGTSIEDRRNLWRLNALRDCGAALKFVSFEPLLEDLGQVDLEGIDWIIIGGESGAGWRPMDHAWARSLRDQARARRIPVWFKQSAAYQNEQGKALQEQDGSGMRWEQRPSGLAAPARPEQRMMFD